jgi:hypothetical protein
MLVAAALGLVWFAFRATSSLGMSSQLESNTATVLFWLVVITLLYLPMLFVWYSDLCDGLKAAREWEAMSPEARAAAMAEAEAAVLAAKPKRRARKKG